MQEKRKRQLTSRANHYLAYLSLSTADFSKTFKNREGQQKAWRNYRRFLKVSMNYQDDALVAAFDELAVFHEFVENSEVVAPVSDKKTLVARSGEAKVVPLQRVRRAKRLSARPGK